MVAENSEIIQNVTKPTPRVLIAIFLSYNVVHDFVLNEIHRLACSTI